MFGRINCSRLSSYLFIIFVTFGTYLNYLHRPTISSADIISSKRYFAVFDCSTPNKTSHRELDYVFYLPLTVLAWQRIGFESVILILGERKDWESDPVLSLILESLDGFSDVATVIFLPGNVKYRKMLGQTARIFVANMKDFPGHADDFIFTTDSDLWPLRKEHYFPPRDNCSLLIVHSGCCGNFDFNQQSYTMLQMSDIGASASTWRQITNINSSVIAYDSNTILEYFQQGFGNRGLQPAKFDLNDWYLDQKYVSIRIEEWINRQNSKDVMCNVSNAGLSRIERTSWNSYHFQPSLLENHYDAHLILEGYLTRNWVTLKPLAQIMYGNSSWQLEWMDKYVKDFNTRLLNWKNAPNYTSYEYRVNQFLTE